MFGCNDLAEVAENLHDLLSVIAWAGIPTTPCFIRRERDSCLSAAGVYWIAANDGSNL